MLAHAPRLSNSGNVAGPCPGPLGLRERPAMLLRPRGHEDAGALGGEPLGGGRGDAGGAGDEHGPAGQLTRQIEQRVIGGDWGANGITTMAQADTLARQLHL